MAGSDSPVIGLDIGHVRIGVARGWPSTGTASPLTTINNDDQVLTTITDLCNVEQPSVLVIGLPRNLDGDDTPQTAYVREFVERLQSSVSLPVVLQDEALTSRKAEAELAGRGKPFQKSDIDALAATYIVEDYLHTAGVGNG
ncbi:MAG: putative Holliday junction resolvase [Candidatus Saccharibacteria bacterium]|nr:putative Holliday junction resolvase [Candidatus Saccharibacteria bacterium]